MKAEKGDKYTQNEELKLKFENVIATGVWIKTVGQIIETIGVSNLYSINEDPTSGDEKVLSAVWIETVGQFLQTIGVSQQISATNEQITFQAQELEIIGVSLKSLAHAIEAIGGIEILQEEKRTDIMDFIP
ncbi:hypothetical protein Q8G31_26510 [Priestia megaterium]|jgi:hypothetical protein|uniref:hypothetical protein n=1 Tax=Priestia megaterium TaxID=1404 RepID=UPI0023D9E8CA|nr:hypothetical protein [Priestia megaterium]MDF2053246.1 hypothetical protein [Priestia megaterium]MDF2062638.1 hypothetical protein [Priestia megaterium]MDP1383274.1 hypothetical protein [Priestia megaterium]MDP1427421.1 hypothetical protein [Priestia megaterium]MDR7247205.1 putative cupin superfamily protein [Priestia megaterium]